MEYDPQRWENANCDSGFVIGCMSFIACKDKNWTRKLN